MSQPSPKPPLAGVRILDLSRLLPGPYATLLLSDLGAQVIKVETPGLGDYARLAPAESGVPAMFRLINRGKKSLGLNYRNKRGRQVFLQLAKKADVIVETFKPGAVDRWGIGYEAVSADNPGIVYCSLSGYGQDGPYRLRPGHDINYIGLGSLLDLTGERDGPPVPPGVQVADMSGAMMAAMGILAALLGRERSGQGAYLDVSMLDTVVSWMMPIAGGWFYGTGTNPKRGRLPLTGGWPCNDIYETADGHYLSLGALEPPFWNAFCQAVGRSDLIEYAFDGEVASEVAEIFRGKTRSEWLETFQDTQVPLEPINRFEEMLHHPQVVHRGMVRDEDLGSKEPFMGSPFPYPPKEGSAPELGQHTREILEEVGFSAEDILDLEEKKIIRLGA